MSTTTDTSLTITRILPARRDRVFAAWTDPEHLRHWFCPEGYTPGEVSSDCTPGGRYRLQMTGEDTEYTAFGVYREVTPPSRVVYTWDWEGDHAVGETLVTVEFNEVGGGTEVVLTHSAFPAAEATEAHLQGWTSCLANLEAYLS